MTTMPMEPDPFDPEDPSVRPETDPDGTPIGPTEPGRRDFPEPGIPGAPH